jgi:drug/metabolite transporter (DMT)-like permease
MGITLGGLILLTRSTSGEGRFPEMERSYLRHTVRLALVASLMFGLQIVVMQEARGTYGAFATTWMTRLVSLAALLGWAVVRRRNLLFPWRALPLVALQGVLDASGAFFMLAGSVGDDRAVVAVIASSFVVLTVILARIFLREPINRFQWLAILAVSAGIALLAGVG